MTSSPRTTISSSKRSRRAPSSGTAPSPLQSASKSKPPRSSKTACRNSAPAWRPKAKGSPASSKPRSSSPKSPASASASKATEHQASASRSRSTSVATTSSSKTLRRKLQLMAAQARYSKTVKGRETYFRYHQSPQGKECSTRFNHTEKRHEHQRRYSISPQDT